MTILNEFANNVKAREIRYISSSYSTNSKEQQNDLILVAKVNYNTILKSIKISSSEAYAGFTTDLVLLNEFKEEITYKSDNDTIALTALNSVDFSTALDSVEKLQNVDRFKTLEEHIKGETNLTHYRGLIYIALKVKTGATTPKEGVKILTDINFIENI